MMNRRTNKISVDGALYESGIDPTTLEALGYEVMNPAYYEGMFADNYLTAFKIMVSRLLKMNPIPDLAFRNQATKILTEAYMNQVGEMPNGIQLTLLSNWILVDQLRDSHPDKVTREDYPIMNKGQLKTRHRREVADEFIEKRSRTVVDKKRFTTEVERN